MKFGEGPIAEQKIEMKGQGFNEDAYKKANAKEIRFTQTKKNLYAIPLGWPEDGKLIIRSLANGSRWHNAKIKKVMLLGYGKVEFERTAEGLEVTLPAEKTNNILPVIKISK